MALFPTRHKTAVLLIVLGLAAGAALLFIRSTRETPPRAETEAPAVTARAQEPAAAASQVTTPPLRVTAARSRNVECPPARKGKGTEGPLLHESFNDIFSGLAGQDCCRNEGNLARLQMVKDACIDYLDAVNIDIAGHGWPTPEQYRVISGNLGMCRQAQAGLSQATRRLPPDRSYFALIDDFRQARWDRIRGIIARGDTPLMPSHGGDTLGTEKNAIQLAVIYDAPPDILESLIRRGLKVPAYVLPMTLERGNTAGFSVLSRHIGINSLDYTGKPIWMGSLYGSRQYPRSIADALVSRGADMSLEFDAHGSHGNALEHYLRMHTESQERPPPSLTAIQAMLRGGARAKPGMLEAALPTEVRSLLTDQIATCGRQ